ncbi:GNAT family N-acetyltransferase [Nocardia sp. NBC_01329]|uniref:GNAT family N-acetyltransferase n=1 Tax=Nocardia sp. NBC_01329 TaxID=2903594 RepID=UPI002E13FDF8|nr:GNAT family N-acetyltransferase [Nocardia sp. NBC_01329]
MSTPPDVRPARRAEIGSLARTLAAAFQDDPVMEWLWPDPGRRASGLPRLFATQTRHQHLANGGVDIALDSSGAIGGVALWDAPGRWKPSVWRELRMLPQLARAFGGRLRAGKELVELMTAVHPDEPHWYLATIGTDPDRRGHGLGQALLQSRLEQCDRDGIPSYLESSKQANIAYYERFGFEVTTKVTVPGGGPDLWLMWRTPRSRA